MKNNECKNPFAQEYKQYAFKFDEAFEKCDWNTTKKLIKECETLVDTNKEDYRYAPIYYSLGTSYSDLMDNLPEYANDSIREKILYCYRICLELLSEKELENQKYKPYINSLKMPLLTNYANILSNCGRKISAIRCYRQALEINSDFQMATGNIGVALLYYATLIHDNGQQLYLHHFAYDYLKSSIKGDSKTVHPNAKKYFQSVIDRYSVEYVKDFLEKPLNIQEYSLGNSREKRYRKWCLTNHLFLNPLNDLPLQHSCFAADTLHLPDILTSISQKDIPIYFGMFNQIKQEYIYARYLCYQACSYSDEPHYADKETNLVNLYDYPQYSIRIENAKTSFRLFYSIFDKVAFFANIYWNLGIKERDVTFHSIWKNRSGKNKYEHSKLNVSNNIALASIYWIYKDFNKKFGEDVDPASKKLNVLRNALEHKYVKVHSDLFNVPKPYVDDEGTYHISESDLLKFTFDLMDMIRELIIDLSMAVHIEESHRKSKFDSNKFIPNVNLFKYDDEWKI